MYASFVWNHWAGDTVYDVSAASQLQLIVLVLMKWILDSTIMTIPERAAAYQLVAEDLWFSLSTNKPDEQDWGNCSERQCWVDHANNTVTWQWKSQLKKLMNFECTGATGQMHREKGSKRLFPSGRRGSITFSTNGFGGRLLHVFIISSTGTIVRFRVWIRAGIIAKTMLIDLRVLLWAEKLDCRPAGPAPVHCFLS